MKGYTELAEGEKDPRNLLLAFSIDRVLLLEFDVKPYIEASHPSRNVNIGLLLLSNSTILPSAISPLLSDHLPMTLTALPLLISNMLFGITFLTPSNAVVL